MLNELLEVEREVLSGNEEAKKKFWKIVGKIKRSEVSDEVIEKAVEIRERIFGKRVILSARAGGLIFLVMFFLSYALFLHLARIGAGLLVLLLVELSVVYFAYLVGRCLSSLITGIKIAGFYKYTPVEFGVKIDYGSYLRASQMRRAMFFGIPILWVHAVLLSQIVWNIGDSAALIPGVLLVTYLPFSYVVHKKLKTGELHRFLRELKILRELILSAQQH